jgi:hypothetical protein
VARLVLIKRGNIPQGTRQAVLKKIMTIETIDEMLARINALFAEIEKRMKDRENLVKRIN